ncbi:MAG: NAD(P)-dependent oxidoreductase [Chloroflexota bacterium]
MKITITGGSGRIARWTCERLLRDGHEVLLFDRESPPAVAHAGQLRGVRTLRGDVMDSSACLEACRGADAVLHLAGILVPQADTFAVNTLGTWNVLEAARQVGVRRVVLASSINVTGIGWHVSRVPFERVRYLPLDEDHPLSPEDSYSLSKLCNEETAAALGRAHGIQTAALRFAAVRDPAQLEAFARDRPAATFERNERGYQGIWSYLDVRDAAQACARALTAESIPTVGAYFIAAPDTLACEPTMSLLQRFIPEWVPLVRSLSGRAGLFSTVRAEQAFGFRAEHGWAKTAD